MKFRVTAPDGSRHVMTADNPEALKHALEQMFGGTPAESELPPMVEVGEPEEAEMPPMVEVEEQAPEPQPDAPYDATATTEPPPHTYIPPEPAPQPPNPMEQLAPLIMEAIDRVVGAIEQQGSTISEAIAAQGEKIEAVAAQQTQSIAGLADAMTAEQEVVRDDEGRVKGARRKVVD